MNRTFSHKTLGIDVSISREDQRNKTIMGKNHKSGGMFSEREGVRPRDYNIIWNFMYSTSCDVLCLQETWTIDSNISMFSSIYNNYLFTCISGIDHTTDIIMGRPQSGVAILYKKSLSGIINHITITNRRMCGINITVNNILLVILSIYMPCDNYSRTIVNPPFSDCIDDFECILNDLQCTSFIGAEDYNTCFNRFNAQTTCLANFIRRII